MENNDVRSRFSNRLGFLLLCAGGAVGLGNIWRFPYIVGVYGGGFFVVIYLIFLVILGLPILIMELAVGRASQKSIALSFDLLEPKGSKWHLFKYLGMAGNYILMSFYTVIGGFIINYLFKTVTGEFKNASTENIQNTFNGMTSSPFETYFFSILIIIVGVFICSLGLGGGMERITKIIMIMLLGLMIILTIRSLTLPGALEGLSFYLKPRLNELTPNDISNAVFAAMGQAFFTLSIGIGSMAIFGSYLDRKRTLTKDALPILLIDTFVALTAGLIIFPACFSYSINPDSGPSLIFITLSKVFASMPLGHVWGSLFFLFLTFAALSTVIAVFENIISFLIDLKGYSRKKSAVINVLLVSLMSLPVALGFNLLAFITPFGDGSNIMDLADFILSNNIISIGALVYLLFCTSRYGFTYKRFVSEANMGRGPKFPKYCRFYLSYILPIFIIVIFIGGYITKFK